MRKKNALFSVFVLVFMLLLICVFQADAETTPAPSPTATEIVNLPKFVPSAPALSVGEKHLYEISWKNIAAGTGEIAVVEKVKDKKSYHIVHMTALSSKFVSVFYKVEDLFISHIDSTNGSSLRFEKQTREGKSYRDELVLYDYAAKKVRYETTKKKGSEPKVKEFELNGLILDPLAAILHLRSTELKVGEQVSLPIHSNEEPWVLKLNVVGLTGLRVQGIGKFNAYKLVPEVKEDALFAAKGAMTLWVEKTTKVILRAEVDIPIGVVAIRMIRAEKSPLESVNRKEKRRRWVRPGTKEIA